VSLEILAQLTSGGFARPISHLAAELNLPPGLVALRHRATHEDLPPLAHLYRALQDSLAYLHTYSFVPLLNHGAEEGWGRRARSEALVGRWKKVMKERVRTRDVTVESESGRAVKRLRREFEGEDLEDAVEAIVRTGLVPVARK
jgi:ribosomal biogenesis protein LAS1